MLHSLVAPHTISLVQPTFTKGGRYNRRLQFRTVPSAGLSDFIGGDLLWPDLGRWLDDVENHKALAVYSPHEGGYEGRYLTRLRYQGYVFLDLSARGLGDPETTLTKIHPVCPVSLSQIDSHNFFINNYSTRIKLFLCVYYTENFSNNF